MTNKSRSLVFAVTIVLIFFSVNISFAVNLQLTGKIKTTTGQEYEGKITSISSSGNSETLKFLYQGNVTFIQVDQLKTIEILDPEKKEFALEFKTGKKVIVNGTNDTSAHLINIYIEQDIGKIKIDIANIKKITFYEILKTEKQ
jgi:hypothetical protein